MAPESPAKTPNNLIFVIFSLKIIADKIKTIIGVVTIITEPFIGVVNWRPLKNANIFSATPKKAAITNLEKSLYSIFSEGVHKLKIQNRIPAKETRNNINPKGCI